MMKNAPTQLNFPQIKAYKSALSNSSFTQLNLSQCQYRLLDVLRLLNFDFGWLFALVEPVLCDEFIVF